MELHYPFNLDYLGESNQGCFVALYCQPIALAFLNVKSVLLAVICVYAEPLVVVVTKIRFHGIYYFT